MPSGKAVLVLFFTSLVILGVAIAVVVLEMRDGEEFPWGTHLVTIPGVFIIGFVFGWVAYQRHVAEEKARQELKADE